MQKLEDENIIAEDGQILVVYKPAGIAVQSRGMAVMDLEHMILNYLAAKTKEQDRKALYLAVVHRLDQPVEGLLVFAKTQKAAASLSRQIQENKMKKEYLAVVEGDPKEQGILEDYLIKEGRLNTSRVAGAGEPGAKKAVLEYQLLQRQKSGRALLKIHLKTGRHHQIRVQLAHAGMPIIGDRKYNPHSEGGQLALCADRLVFMHPETGCKQEYQVKPNGIFFREFAI